MLNILGKTPQWRGVCIRYLQRSTFSRAPIADILSCPLPTKQATQAPTSHPLPVYSPFFPFPSGGSGAEHELSDGEAERKRDAADYLDFLSSEFMARLNSAGDAHEQRRQSQWKRDFENALDKRKQKQARSDEFFEIYR